MTGYAGKVTALSDLITVENSGTYASSPMTVTIPVAIPKGMFAMGFFRQGDGTLEAMPVVDETPMSVTVATRHFSSFLVLAIAATFYNGTKPITTVDGGKVGAVQLGNGINDLGVYIEGKVGATWWFVDFQRFELVAPPQSGMPTAAPPTPRPTPTFDCSIIPEGGIARINWSLHGEGIDQPLPQDGPKARSAAANPARLPPAGHLADRPMLGRHLRGFPGVG